jgi:hypothetical protein
MASITMTSRAFDEAPGAAQEAAKDGPVFITDNGRLAYVLLAIEDYRKLAGETRSIVDMLAVPEEEYFDFDPPRMQGFGLRIPDLS